MRDVLQTHRDVGLLGVRHRTWMIVFFALFLVCFLSLVLRSSPDSVTVNDLQKSFTQKRIAIVMPLHTDRTKQLAKRFRMWNTKRRPCTFEYTKNQLKPDFIFYVGPEAKANLKIIEEQFQNSEARKCFNHVEILNVDASHNAKESEESYAFYRLFGIESFKNNYDLFFYMSPFVWQVKEGWANKIVAEATLSDPFWVKGSAAMHTCPKKALTPEGDCDGSINLAFPAVLHINMNALYCVNDPEFSALLTRAETKYPGVGCDVAIYKELVSTDHPLHEKIKRGGSRRTLSVQEHHEDPALSHARQKGPSHHITSLYWAAHAHRYRYTDFIVNALAGKKHFKDDLDKGLHPNTFLVHQGISE